MRKNKKLLSLAISACMVGSMLAGCSEQSSDDSDATSSAVETEVESTEEDVESSSEEKEEESSSEEETESAENYDAEGTAAGEFIQQVMATKGMTSYTATSEIVINDVTDYNGDVDETEFTLGLVEMVDGNGNMSLTISADFEDPDDVNAFAIHGDLLTLSKIDDRIYLDMTGLYEPMVYILMGSDMEEMEEYYEAFGTTSEEAEALLTLSIPIGDLDLSETDYTALEDVMELVADDLAESLDSLGEDFMTVDGDTYTFTVNNGNVIDIADAVLSVLDGNVEAIYDAYVEYVKASDYSEYLDSVINAVIGELVEGWEEAAGDDLDAADIEEQITGFIEAYETTVEENIASLEDDKQEFLDEFASILEEFNDEKDDAKELAAEEGADSVSAVVAVTFDGEEGSRVINSDMTFEMNYSDEAEYAEDELYEGSEAYSYYMSESVSISIKTTIEEGDVTISAPEGYATLADLAKFCYNLEEIYDEYVVDDYDATTDYEYDDDYDYSYLYNDYTQAELCEIYGVTLADDQVIACDTVDNDGVIITACDGMEFFSPDDTCSMMMEVDDDYSAYVTIFVYDNSFNAEFYEEYYDAEMVEDDICYYEPYDGSAYLVYFGDNITIEIDLDTSDDDALEEMTNGDNVTFLKGLLDLCEIVSPAE